MAIFAPFIAYFSRQYLFRVFSKLSGGNLIIKCLNCLLDAGFVIFLMWENMAWLPKKKLRRLFDTYRFPGPVPGPRLEVSLVISKSGSSISTVGGKIVRGACSRVHRAFYVHKVRWIREPAVLRDPGLLGGVPTPKNPHVDAARDLKNTKFTHSLWRWASFYNDWHSLFFHFVIKISFPFSLSIVRTK